MKIQMFLKDFFKALMLLVLMCFSQIGLGQTAQNLPYSLPTNALRSDLTSANGWSYVGLGTDYSSSGSNIKFDTTSDNATLFIASTPNLLSYNLKGNSLSGSYVFDLLESANGLDFIVTQNITSGIGTTNTVFQKVLLSTTRYIRWRYTTKATGNIGFGGVTISIGASTPTLSTSASTLSGFIYPFASGPSTSQSFNLSGANLTGFNDNITITGSANYEVSSDNIAFGTAVNIPYTSAILTNTPIYVRLKSGLAVGNYNSENLTISGGGDTDGASVACNGSVTYTPCFTDSDSFEKVAVFTNSENDVWVYATGTYSLNGYNAGGSEQTNQWLILGDLDLSTYNSGNVNQLLLNATEGFSGTDLTVFATTSYTGCPSDAANSWVSLGTITATGTNQTFDLASLAGQSSVYIGIQYLDNDGTYSSWTLSNIKIQTNASCFTVNTPVISNCIVPPAISTNVTVLNGFTYTEGAGPSAEQSFTISGSNLTSSVVITPPTNWEVSTVTGSGFQTTPLTLPLTATLSPTTIYTRMVVGLTNGASPYSGTLNCTSGTASKDLVVNGTVSAGLPAVPVASIATNVDDTTFYANWNAVAGATSYAIDVSTSPTFGSSVTTTTDLMISEYFEGSSNNKYIEIYNGTGANVDLSDYKLNLYGNGSTTATTSITLSGVLANNSTIVYQNSSATLFSGINNSAVNFNGDDAIALFKISTSSFVDIIGEIGNDPGTSWTAGLSSTVNQTLVRNSNIINGVSVNPTGLGFATLATEWTSYNIDTILYLGSHNFIGTSTPSFVIGYENSNVGNSTSFQITGLETGTKYYYRVKALNGSLVSDNSNSIAVTTTGTVKWLGTTNANWSTASNWSNELVPDGTYDLEIPLGTPILDVDFTVQSGKSFTISGTGTLVINPLASLTVQGTANFGGKRVTLQSDATGTAAIREISGNLSNATNVTIERYIPAKRAWRALTAPLRGSNGSLYATWQNGGSSIAATGVEMWGPSGTNLATGSNYSVLNYTPTGWVGVNNTSTSNLFDATNNKAYFVFVTGAYGNGNIASGASATTLKATGELITGDVTYNAIIDTKHTLIGNPYACPLDPSKILTGSNNLTGSFWVWDPNLATSGAYVSYDNGLGTYSNSTGSYPTNTTNIQSGQAFFVKATNGNTGSFTLSENKKAIAVSNVFGKNTNQNLNDSSTASILRFGLFKESNQEWKPLDGALAGFYDTANNAVDNNDGKKLANGSENIAFVRNNITMSSEHFSNPQPLDEIYIRIWNTIVNNYKLKINTESFSLTNIQATLVDLFTGVQTPIALDGTVQEYPFAVTSEIASTGDRFKVVFNSVSLSNPLVEKESIKIYPNPATNGIINVKLPDEVNANYSYELVNVMGQKVMSDAIETSSMNTFSINTKQLTSSWYALKIVKAGNVIYQTRVIIIN